MLVVVVVDVGKSLGMDTFVPARVIKIGRGMLLELVIDGAFSRTFAAARRTISRAAHLRGPASTVWEKRKKYATVAA